MLAADQPPPSVVGIAIEESSELVEFEPSVIAVCEELGESFPTPKEAARLATADVVARITSESVSPRDGLIEIEKISHAVLNETGNWDKPHNAESDPWVICDVLGLHKFYGLYLSYEQVADGPVHWEINGKFGDAAIAELDSETLSSATSWMTAHGTAGSSQDGERRQSL